MAININDVGELVDRVVHINRVAKVVKGGRRFSLLRARRRRRQHGHVGAGLGKANEVPEAIRKGTEQAKKNLFKIPLDKGTIPHEVLGHFGAGKVLLKPASRRYRRHRRRRGPRGARSRGHPGHPDQVHRHVEPAQRDPRDGRRRCSSCARPKRRRASRGKTARGAARRKRQAR